jgi:hypothetical protein
LLPERKVNHPLGCHRSRVADQVVFEELVQVLVFGCAYWRIADGSCSDTTCLEERGLLAEIAQKGKPAPLIDGHKALGGREDKLLAQRPQEALLVYRKAEAGE